MGMQLLLLFFSCFLLFFCGMAMMKYGFQQMSHRQLEKWLYNCTNAPIKSFLTGMIATALVHSSSLVMVITVSFVSAGLLKFKDAIGIILGSNVGTTFTTEFLAVEIDDYLGIMFAISLLLMLFKNRILFSLGCSCFGISCIFLALNGFEKAAFLLSDLQVMSDLLSKSSDHLLFSVGISAVFTGIIQSSTALIGIVMSFMNEQLLPLETGLAFVLGANIGTCITALLASIGSKQEAKYTAFAHLWLNVFGVILFVPLIPFFANNLKLLTNEPDFQIAHFSLIFNLITSLIILPFANQYANFVLWWTKTISAWIKK
ncbi:Na/Pi symporter [Aeribacillus pallidus]|jgi:phosphate:Na+ symporter